MNLVKDLKGIAKEMVAPMAKASLVCLGGAALLGIILDTAGCGSTADSDEPYFGWVDTNYEGFKALGRCDDFGRRVTIHDTSAEDVWARYITALDRSTSDAPFDGRFDLIELYNVPIGHPLEKHANSGSLEKAWGKILRDNNMERFATQQEAYQDSVRGSIKIVD